MEIPPGDGMIVIDVWRALCAEHQMWHPRTYVSAIHKAHVKFSLRSLQSEQCLCLFQFNLVPYQQGSLYALLPDYQQGSLCALLPHCPQIGSSSPPNNRPRIATIELFFLRDTGTEFCWIMILILHNLIECRDGLKRDFSFTGETVKVRFQSLWF